MGYEEVCDRNNYINNYINKLYDSIPRFCLKLSIDLVKLSIADSSVKEQLDIDLTSNGFRVTSDLLLSKGSYGKKRTYETDDFDVTVDIFYNLKSKSLTPLHSLMITIHDPNQEFINLFDSILRFHSISFKTSLIELTFDCFTNDRIALYDFFQSHLFLKHQKSASFKYKTTYYTNNLRKSSKGIRLYLKKNKEVKKFVRLELVLKRQILRRSGLEFPFREIDSFDISKFIKFMYVDTYSLCEHFIRISRKDIDKCNKKRSGSGDLVVRHIESWISTHFGDDEVSLMRQVEVLKSQMKGEENYMRFLKPLSVFNEAFTLVVKLQSFIQKMKEYKDESPQGHGDNRLFLISVLDTVDRSEY